MKSEGKRKKREGGIREEYECLNLEGAMYDLIFASQNHANFGM